MKAEQRRSAGAAKAERRRSGGRVEAQRRRSGGGAEVQRRAWLKVRLRGLQGPCLKGGLMGGGVKP